jgi:hypothetical protein
VWMVGAIRRQLDGVELAEAGVVLRFEFRDLGHRTSQP